MKESLINIKFDKVMYINMKKDIEKNKKTKKILKQKNIKASRFNAINGSSLTKKQLKQYSFFTRNFIPLSVIGCALSHMKVWEKIVKYKWKYTLILEDDIYFHDKFDNIYDKVSKTLPVKWDLLYFGATAGNQIDRKYNKIMKILIKFLKVSGYQSNNYYKINNSLYSPELPLCTHSYGISYKCAKHFLKLIKEPCFHIDSLINKHMKNINVYSIHPNIIGQNTENSSNTLNNYPFILTKFLKKQKNITSDVGLDYLISVKYFRIGKYNLTISTIIYILIGLLIQPYTNILILIIVYLTFSLPDLYNDHHRAVEMNLIFIILGYLIRK